MGKMKFEPGRFAVKANPKQWFVSAEGQLACKGVIVIEIVETQKCHFHPGFGSFFNTSELREIADFIDKQME